MNTKRHQFGTLIYRESARDHMADSWVARWIQEEVVDGVPHRVHKSKVLGLAKNLSKDKAQALLDKIVFPLNHDTDGPIQQISYDGFVKKFEADLLPALRGSTSHFYQTSAGSGASCRHPRCRPPLAFQSQEDKRRPLPPNSKPGQLSLFGLRSKA